MVMPVKNMPEMNINPVMTIKLPLNFKNEIFFWLLFKSPPTKAYPSIDHKKMGKWMVDKIKVALFSL